MAANHRERFFDGVKDHSQIKLRAFRRYLQPWASRVGSMRAVERVWIVDGFAGAGQYLSGELGSAGLALEFASGVAHPGRGYKVSVFLVDRDRGNVRSLERIRVKHGGIEGPIVQGDFWAKTAAVAEMVGHDPVLLFIDPFGLKDLDFAGLVSLCKRLPRVDLMVNFMSPVAARLAPNYSALVDSAVGGPGWQLESLTATFTERLATSCSFLQPAVLPVSANLGDLKYELVMAARHPSAYGLWNDEIATEDRNVLDGSSQADQNDLIDAAKEVLRAEIATRRTFGRDAVIADLKVRDCGRFHHRVYLRGVQDLLKNGEWVQGSGPVATAPIRKA